ncbi:hypothetical protein T492DRAFT_1075391 [Pavlovales sp. CCMP2436]|nr:hypothetical protein T492DRAFT_1075391 [Pavlovales sp. CCMP2436]|mmetsp:Transcript_44997/g.103852  ORF Transcript_44997/g.103852 Transcript_44997/m.103852 type:complete len:205 (+) Transcript_44997:520-1134(+)
MCAGRACAPVPVRRYAGAHSASTPAPKAAGRPVHQRAPKGGDLRSGAGDAAPPLPACSEALSTACEPPAREPPASCEAGQSCPAQTRTLTRSRPQPVYAPQPGGRSRARLAPAAQPREDRRAQAPCHRVRAASSPGPHRAPASAAPPPPRSAAAAARARSRRRTTRARLPSQALRSRSSTSGRPALCRRGRSPLDGHTLCRRTA